MEPNPIALMVAKEMGFIEHKEKKGLYYQEIGKGDVAYIDFRKSNIGGRYGNIAGKLIEGDKIPLLVEYQKIRDKFLEMQLTTPHIEQIKHAIKNHFMGVIPIKPKEASINQSESKIEEKNTVFKTALELEKENREQRGIEESSRGIAGVERKEQKMEGIQMLAKNQEETKTIVVSEVPEIVVPKVDVETVVKHFNLFQELKRRVLQDEDYLFIGPDGRPTEKGKHVAEHIKKTGWSKLALIFNLNMEILKREKLWCENNQGKYYVWTYHVRATAPNGRYQEAEGCCSSRDPFFAKRYDPKTKEEYWIEPDEKNIMLKAQSVAFNRAVSFLIGGGELSAEEVESGI